MYAMESGQNFDFEFDFKYTHKDFWFVGYYKVTVEIWAYEMAKKGFDSIFHTF